MQRIMALDPGPSLSAWIIYQPGRTPIFNGFAKESNEQVRNRIFEMSDHFDLLVIERVVPYNNPKHGGVSDTIVDTGIEIGRFVQVGDSIGKEHVLMKRKTIVAALTGSAQNGDPEVRAALIKRFGPPGTVKSPGPTYGIVNDIWQALACGTAYLDKNVIQPFKPAFLP